MRLLRGACNPRMFVYILTLSGCVFHFSCRNWFCPQCAEFAKKYRFPARPCRDRGCGRLGGKCAGKAESAGPLALRFRQLVKKSLAEFRVRRRESIIICFLPRHVRGRKHFARSERRIVRYQRTTEAQNAAKLSRKSGKATFSTVSRKRRAARPALSRYTVCRLAPFICASRRTRTSTPR